MREDAQSEAGRLLWRCRRGMKELDLLLERFMRNHYGRASSDQQRAFRQLLDLPDLELADYLLGHATPIDPALAQLAQLITSRDCV